MIVSKRTLESGLVPYLPDNALDELVHGEGNVGMDGEHLPQLVLILRGLHIPVQKIAHHLQKGGVVVLNVNVHWNRAKKHFCNHSKLKIYLVCIQGGVARVNGPPLFFIHTEMIPKIYYVHFDVMCIAALCVKVVNTMCCRRNHEAMLQWF